MGRTARRREADRPWRWCGFSLFAVAMRRVLHDVHLDGPPDSCRQALLESPLRWLPAAEAVADGRYRARVHFGDGVRVRKEVALTVSQAARQADRIVIPVTWRATGPKEMFPVFEGEFRLRPLRPRVCRLSLTCTYEPPLGDFGRRLDEAGLRRMAEAAVRDLTCAVATRVAELAASHPARHQSDEGCDDGPRNA
jgi:hypothetical protein